ncbi:uncharacterized protein LOC127255416 [Andrographis paniculata]|uniref:uncharacterized protein LOC127255416 n=1 Tax=Andrographis paniculata TaxID=175694 RepID=UPI0021E85AF3|nr:uncharacterized protein LOC127255416 [Andrographis paniculata]
MVENGADDCYEPRLSIGFMSCLVPPAKCVEGPKASLSYEQLYPQPLQLTVLKLDGSSFRIEVEQAGTVRDLKRAVEAAFRHLPKKGPRSVSWEHVWGQFCLCHEGQKLLNDGDYIGMISIRDGDQLQFIHHASYAHQLAGVPSRPEELDSDDECDYSAYSWDKHQNNGDDDESARNLLDTQNDVTSQCDYNLTHTIRGCFSYHKFSNQPRGGDERSTPSKASNNILGSLKHCLRLPCNKRYPRRQTPKGE